MLGGAITAWEYLPIVLRWREEQALTAARRIVRSYLEGSLSFDAAASALAEALRRNQRLWERRQGELGPGTLVAEAFDLAPPGTAADDPRITRLQLQAMRLSIPPDVSPAFRALVERHLDSLAATLGPDPQHHPQ
jgi:hypothetical protein